MQDFAYKDGFIFYMLTILKNKVQEVVCFIASELLTYVFFDRKFIKNNKSKYIPLFC